MTQIFVDHHLLTRLAGTSPDNTAESEEFREFRVKIRNEVMALDDNHRQVIIMYYFECREIDQIAAEMNLDLADIRRLLREGLMQLEHTLTDIVSQRWPDRFKAVKHCLVCEHPERKQIEEIIRAQKPTESWGRINSRIKRKVGRTFNPPSVIISHLKYHMKE